MTTTTHQISINENPRICNGMVSAKRVSKSRQYGACVVATATQKTVDDIALGLADHERHVAELSPALLSVLQANGYETIEAFEAAHKAASEAWHGPRTEERKKLTDAVEAATGKRFHFLSDAENKVAEAAVEARGFVNPHGAVMGPLWTLVWNLKRHTSSIAHIKSQNVQVGDQIVVTWCRDVGLAQKAARGKDAKHYAAKFYALTVRTDIVVTSK